MNSDNLVLGKSTAPAGFGGGLTGFFFRLSNKQSGQQYSL